MSTTITQKPNKLVAANSPMVFIISESVPATYNAFKFRYIAQVFINGVEKSRLKIPKNASNVAIVDISHIVRSYVETQESNVGDIGVDTANGSIHELGVSIPANLYSQNTNQLVKVEVKAGFEKADTALLAPTETLNQANTTIYAIPATTPYTKTATNVGGLDISGTNNPLKFFENNSTNEELYSVFTNAPNVQYVRGGSSTTDNKDLLTICFKQGDSGASSLLDFGDDITDFTVKYYNASNSALNSVTVTCNATNGGSTPGLANTTEESILYFGCGTRNFEQQTINDDLKPSDSGNNGWAYYVVTGRNSSGDNCTKNYYFLRYGAIEDGLPAIGSTFTQFNIRNTSCTKYPNIRLAWRNRLGAWDYMNFRGKSINTLNIQGQEMESVPGTWDSATYNYENYDRGKKSLFKTADKQISVTSDFLTEEESIWLEELFTSINIQLIDDNDIVYPVVIRERSYTVKTTVNDKQLIQYQFTLNYSNPIRTNS